MTHASVSNLDQLSFNKLELPSFLYSVVGDLSGVNKHLHMPSQEMSYNVETEFRVCDCM